MRNNVVTSNQLCDHPHIDNILPTNQLDDTVK